MRQRQNGGDGKLPFKTEPDIDHDRRKRTDHGKDTLLCQFRADSRANEFSPAHIVICTKRFCDRFDGSNLRLFIPVLTLNADKNVGLAAETLKADITEAEVIKVGSQTTNFGWSFGIARLDQDAAAEIDAEIKADDCEHRNRRCHQQARETKSRQAQFQEIDLCFAWYEFQPH